MITEFDVVITILPRVGGLAHTPPLIDLVFEMENIFKKGTRILLCFRTYFSFSRIKTWLSVLVIMLNAPLFCGRAAEEREFNFRPPHTKKRPKRALVASSIEQLWNWGSFE